MTINSDLEREPEPGLDTIRKPDRRAGWSAPDSGTAASRRWRWFGAGIGLVLAMVVTALILVGKDNEAPVRKSQTRATAMASLGSIPWWTISNPTVAIAEDSVKITTSLSAPVQSIMRRKAGPLAGRAVGVVLLDADTGRIRAMHGFNPPDTDGNPCAAQRYPIAGLFQLVTASAALADGTVLPTTSFPYSGPPNRLVADEIASPATDGGQSAPLSQALAETIYPVFGRLGVDPDTAGGIDRMAAALGFTTAIPVGPGIAVIPSIMAPAATPREKARRAAGFNLETEMTPVHGALLAAAMVNGGRLVRPTVVERIADTRDQTLYVRPPGVPPEVISSFVADNMADMMEGAVANGATGTRFRDMLLEGELPIDRIGGLSAVVSDDTGEYHTDWFIGFGTMADETIAVATVVVHYRIAGVRADYIAGLALKRYFASRADMISNTGQ